MALPPLPASNTKRYFLLYDDSVNGHSLQCRVADTVSDGAAISALTAFVNALLPDAYHTTTYSGVEVAEEGSDIRNPVAGWTSVIGTGVTTIPGNVVPYSKNLRGRSATGRKTKMELFGLTYEQPADWETPIADSLLVTFFGLLAITTGFFLAIDGTTPVWKPNYTISVNDHWVNEARP